jgi:hypothetical protein
MYHPLRIGVTDDEQLAPSATATANLSLTACLRRVVLRIKTCGAREPQNTADTWNWEAEILIFDAGKFRITI